ncbi:hypothetical protein [Tabrizicola flagellatus]|uniref:hypothetical protein n=1 Tax=Tabrizicola flagellatus TaxID=2593021 RepID=UPI0011F1BFC1|nr:hypothetical protein [Tabrizicola flagellatus]
MRKSLGPLASHLKSDRDCVGLTGFTTDLDSDPEAARLALADGREFLEGIDIVDPAFCAWLADERQRLAERIGTQDVTAPGLRDSQPFTLRLGSLPAWTGADVARDLAEAVARLAAEHLLRDRAAGFGASAAGLQEGLDLQIEGAWSEDRAHLKLRLLARSNQKTIWIRRLIATRHIAEEGQGALPALVIETTDAPIM